MPVGAALHANQREESYKKIFSSFRSLWGETILTKIVNFMTDDSSALKNGLKDIFPTIKQLLCHFHLMQALWRWLFNAKNNISPDHRIHLLNLFRGVIYAKSLEDMNRKEEELLNDSIATLYKDTYIKHVTRILLRKEECCMALRLNIQNMRHNTNNYAEATFRILKDIILTRLKAYNAIALLDFLINVMDKYYSRRLTNVAFGRENSRFIMYDRIVSKAKDVIEKYIIEKNGEVFFIKNEAGEVLYETGVGFCSCPAAMQGTFCKHQCAIHIKYDLCVFPNAPTLTLNEKKLMLYVANKTTYFDDSFLKGMMEDTDKMHVIDEISFKTENDEIVTENDEIVKLTPNKSTVEERKQDCAKEDNLNIVKEFKEEMERMGLLLEQNKTDDNLIKQAKKYLSKVKQVQTGTQLYHFCTSSVANLYKVSGRKIRVQPTSIARRKATTPKGSLCRRAGRPVLSIKKTKKASHSLHKNIMLNRPNAKSHGDGH